MPLNILKRLQFGELATHRMVLLASVILSAAGVAAGYFWENPDFGGRGGAIAVAISLVALFANKPHGREYFELRMYWRDQFEAQLATNERQEPSLERLAKDLTDIAKWLKIDIEGQGRLNIYMSIGAAIGTIVWGFGDWGDKLLLGMPIFSTVTSCSCVAPALIP